MVNLEIVESELKTNKSKDYLWNKMNSPEKIIEIEEFEPDAKIKKISDNNFEIKDSTYHVLITFIPNKGVNKFYFYKDYSLLTWFEIRGEENCTLAHGKFRVLNSEESEEEKAKEIKWLKNHFLEELKHIAK